jgi:hypothetical protein
MPDKENDATRLWELKIIHILAVLLFSNILYSCTPKDAITPKGIRMARLGKEMPTSQNPYPDYKSRDTIFQADGYTWPAWIVEADSGLVWIEGDFLAGKTINRLRIETAAFVFQKKVRVGNRLQALYEVDKSWEATFLRDFGKVDIACKGVHFLVDESAISAAIKEGTEPAKVIDPEIVNKDAIIESIVVF